MYKPRARAPGKEAFYDLAAAVTVADGGTRAMDFWGGGAGALQLMAAGLDVTAAEMKRSLHDALRSHALIHGYRAFCGNATRLDESFDLVLPDYCGPISGTSERELRVLSGSADQWMAVTVAPDHQMDWMLQVEWASVTLPALLASATGMAPKYVSHYPRNEGNTRMWVVLLERDPLRMRLHPQKVSWSIEVRGYWASADMYRRFADWLPWRAQPCSRAARQSTRRWRKANPDKERAYAARLRDRIGEDEWRRRTQVYNERASIRRSERTMAKPKTCRDCKAKFFKASPQDRNVRCGVCRDPNLIARRRRAANPEHYRRNQRRWRVDNPERVQEYRRRQQSRRQKVVAP